jgi:uncharacterized protein (TIGR03032 family)
MTDPTAPGTGPQTPFRAVHSPGLPGLLRNLGISLLVSTYQAGKLMAVREADGAVHTLLRSFDRPMGLAVQDNRRFALGTRLQILEFRNAPDVAPRLLPAGRHDAYFLPRLSHVTGDVLGHELAWVGDELWMVNTLFSCLCSFHPDYSFVPRWRPPFITALLPEDRCHLNGMAIVNGQPRYATALGETSIAEGWRPGKAGGGVVIDIPSGQVVARGLSMPHSPRFHLDRLWLLEGGQGRLLVLDPVNCRIDIVAQLPGFTRGLGFQGPYAFVGLSQIRESAWFGGLPISARPDELRCGISVLDIRTGEVAHFMEFVSGVTEIFAIEVLAGLRFPEVAGFQDGMLDRTFVVPP